VKKDKILEQYGLQAKGPHQTAPKEESADSAQTRRRQRPVLFQFRDEMEAAQEAEAAAQEEQMVEQLEPELEVSV